MAGNDKIKAVYNNSIWSPQKGPQTLFLQTDAYEVLYGGAKGGGKSDVLLFASLRFIDNCNYKALIVRRTFPKLLELIERSRCFKKLGAKYNVQQKFWRFPSGAIIRFGHCENSGDENNYQGQEYQYIGFDQLEEYTEVMYNIIKAQGRTSKGLPVFIRSTANPGGIGALFIKNRFIDGKESNKKYYRTYLVDGNEIVLSSVFIPSTVYDNKILMTNDPSYAAKLMDLPEKYRKMYLDGDWSVENDPDQLIEYNWIQLSTEEKSSRAADNTCLYAGVDIARYGDDSTCVAIIQDETLTEIREYKKIDLVQSTNIIRRLIEEENFNPNNIAIDCDGIGAGVYDNLKSYGYDTVQITGGAKPPYTQDQSYQFKNTRSFIYWNLRERIRNGNIKLYLNKELINELISVKYKISQDRMIQIESKEEIKKRIGKSPDLADAVCYAAAVPFFNKSKEISLTIF